MTDDAEDSLARLRENIVIELGARIGSNAAPSDVIKTAQGWYRLDSALDRVDVDKAVATTRLVLNTLSAASRTPSAADLDLFRADLDHIRAMVQLAGNPTVPRKKKKLVKTPAITDIVSALALPHDF